MKLYHIQFDGASFWIEASSFGDAVGVWKAHVSVLLGDDYDDTEEPESVHLVHDEPVLREAT